VDIGETVVDERKSQPWSSLPVSKDITESAVSPNETNSDSSSKSSHEEPSHTDKSENEDVADPDHVAQLMEGSEGGLHDDIECISDMECSEEIPDNGMNESRQSDSKTYDFLYHGCPIRENESVILFSLFASRHHLSDVAVIDLLTLISLHCPFPNNCTKSQFRYKRIRNKVFSDDFTQEKKLLCGSCSHETDSNACMNVNCSNYQKAAFKPCTLITLPIVPQLQRLVSEYWHQLSQDRITCVSSQICDVTDGHRCVPM
jgi:hypothetical protein